MRTVANQMPATDPGAVRLAVVGESLGADEEAMGYPFAGKSGWALNGFLASAGISRSQVFVGNVAQVRPSPTSNEFHLFDWNGAAVQEGIAALRADLERFRPNIVVALGNAALHLLRHGNIAPPKSAKLRLFQWRSHVGTWRGSLFLAASSFDRYDAATLRMSEGRCPPLAVETLSVSSSDVLVSRASEIHVPTPGNQATPTGISGNGLSAVATTGEPAQLVSNDPSYSPSNSGHLSCTSNAPLSPVAQRDDTPGGGSFSMASLRPLSGDSDPSLVAAHSLAPLGIAVLPPDEAITIQQTFAQTDLVNSINRLGKEHLRKLGWPVEALLAGQPGRLGVAPLEHGSTPSLACQSFGEGDVTAGSAIGHALSAVALPPFKCLATYHPAATFREPSFAFPLVSDLKRAVVEARSPLLELPPRRIVWGLAIEELEARCAAIRAARQPVGFDIEGGLGGLQCASFATTPGDAFVIDLMGERFDRPRTMAAIASVLEDAAVPKVLWNAAYERAILHAVASITLRGYEDGMLAWWERFSELPKGLDFVASILTREPYWAEGIGWDRKTGAPKVTGAPFFTYNGLDSCVTLEIWQHPLIRAVAESRTPVAFTL